MFEETFKLDANYISTSGLSSLPYAVKQVSGGIAPTKVYSMFFNNTSAAVRYVKLANTSATTAITGISAQTPLMRIGIAAGESFTYDPLSPIKFNTGLSVYATSTAGDDTNGAVVAGDVHGFIVYS